MIIFLLFVIKQRYWNTSTTSGRLRHQPAGTSRQQRPKNYWAGKNRLFFIIQTICLWLWFFCYLQISELKGLGAPGESQEDVAEESVVGSGSTTATDVSLSVHLIFATVMWTVLINKNLPMRLSSIFETI